MDYALLPQKKTLKHERLVKNIINLSSDRSLHYQAPPEIPSSQFSLSLHQCPTETTPHNNFREYISPCELLITYNRWVPSLSVAAYLQSRMSWLCPVNQCTAAEITLLPPSPPLTCTSRSVSLEATLHLPLVGVIPLLH